MSHAKQLHHRRYLDDYLEIINREGLPGKIQNDLCLQVQDTVIATVQHVIEAALEEELHAYLGLDRTELVGSDGANGLESPLDHHLYGVVHQRCIFHKIKQLADHLVFGKLPVEPNGAEDQATRQAKRQRKKAVLADASWVYDGASEAQIRQRAEAFRQAWANREPEAVANFFVDFDKALAYLSIAFPESLWGLIRTTNLLERFHKEVRRKQHDIGMFQSEQGCEVIWYMLARRDRAGRLLLPPAFRKPAAARPSNR